MISEKAFTRLVMRDTGPARSHGPHLVRTLIMQRDENWPELKCEPPLFACFYLPIEKISV